MDRPFMLKYLPRPRRLPLDENVRVKEGGKDTWSLAFHHQSLAFHASLHDEKNEAPEDEAAKIRYSVSSTFAAG